MKDLRLEIPRVNPLPFLIIDVVLVGAAALIGWQAEAPLGVAPLAAISLCMALGAVAALYPFVANYARQQEESLKERADQIEAISRTVAASAEQISIAVSNLPAIADNAARQLKAAEQLPAALQVQLAGLQQQLCATANEENAALRHELDTLRGAETGKLMAALDRVTAATADLERLEGLAARHSSALDQALTQLPKLADHFGQQAGEVLRNETAAAVAALRTASAAAEAALKEATADLGRLDAVATRHAAALDTAIGQLPALADNFGQQASAVVRGETATAVTALQAAAAEVGAALAAATAEARAGFERGVRDAVSHLAAQATSTPPFPAHAATGKVIAVEPAVEAAAVGAAVVAAQETAATASDEETTAEAAAEVSTVADDEPVNEDESEKSETEGADAVAMEAEAAADDAGAEEADAEEADVEEAETAATGAEETEEVDAAVAEETGAEETDAKNAEAGDEAQVLAAGADEARGEIAPVLPDQAVRQSLIDYVPGEGEVMEDGDLDEPEVAGGVVAGGTEGGRRASEGEAAEELDEAAQPDASEVSGDAEPVVAANEPALTNDGFTRLIATAFIGLGNKLYIRGDGPGLRQDKGVPLQFVSIGKWRWESAELLFPASVRLFKNDQVECVALGEFSLEPGHHHEVNAKF